MGRHSKSSLLYQQIKLDLQAGHYPPGGRIDPGALAKAFDTSPTPVRLALCRLVGEGLVADHGREGFHALRVTEHSLRDLYDWMERLLLLACSAPQSTSTSVHTLASLPATHDIATLTSHVFEVIARGSHNTHLLQAVQRANDELNPVRRAKSKLLADGAEELHGLHTHWCRRELAALRAAIRRYHRRRRRLASEIVAALEGAPLPAVSGPAEREFETPDTAAQQHMKLIIT